MNTYSALYVSKSHNELSGLVSIYFVITKSV
uniref:Uncharacterized protein n=1 Tax=Arundo donax TaxID=35708 RepID=A0A0A8YT58_ARUDO